MEEVSRNVSVSVIIPSALKKRPGSEELWVSRAMRCATEQTLLPAEVIIGVDPGATLITQTDYSKPGVELRVVAAPKKGHQAACNAAARAANGEYLAFLEDDDEWEPNHLECMVKAAMEFKAGFVTASQVEVSLDGEPIREFHFATMSSWLISKGKWDEIGGVDERFQIHHDNDFLCRHAASWNPTRVHLIPEGVDGSHPWLREISQYTGLCSIPHYTVMRTVHGESILHDVLHDKHSERAARSQKEYACLEVLYGGVGW